MEPDNESIPSRQPSIHRLDRKVPTFMIQELKRGASDRSQVFPKQKWQFSVVLGHVMSVLLVTISAIAGVVSVTSDSLAIRLGQTNQLVVLGFVLSVMTFAVSKEARTLLLVVEARIGQSTLQNYDAILRDDSTAFQISSLVRFSLLAIFLFPLGLSASYKQFVNGSTSMPIQNHTTLYFAPSAPPGLFVGVGRSLVANASAALYPPDTYVPGYAPQLKSYGYNMFVINKTAAAMLDTPVPMNMTVLQSNLLGQATSLTLTATVNATFARLNNTPTSPERQNPNYFKNLYHEYGFDRRDDIAFNDSTYMSLLQARIDSSLVHLAYWNSTAHIDYGNASIRALLQTFESQANAFNIYRGTATGTWMVTADSVRLLNASNFETTFDVNRNHPAIIAPGVCDWNNATDPDQKIIYCAQLPPATNFITGSPDYLLGPNPQGYGRIPSDLSAWTAIIATMGWAQTAAKLETYGIVNETLAYIIDTPQYQATQTFTVLKKHPALYGVILAQPVILILIFIARFFLRSTPMGDTFGLISLLAAVQRDSLDVLKQGALTGEVPSRIILQVVVARPDRNSQSGQGSDETAEPGIQYVLWEKKRYITREISSTPAMTPAMSPSGGSVAHSDFSVREI